MKKSIAFLLAACASLSHAATPGHPSRQDIQSAAAKLGHLYDTDYAAHDAAAMAQLYAQDGLLVSPGGKLIKGRAALKQYYEQRFQSGAKDHHIHVLDANVQGNGGFSIAEFSVDVPNADGTFRRETGHIVAVFVMQADGWHFRAVEPSVAPKE